MKSEIVNILFFGDISQKTVQAMGQSINDVDLIGKGAESPKSPL